MPPAPVPGLDQTGSNREPASRNCVMGRRIQAHPAQLPVTLRGLRFVSVAVDTEISRPPSVWRLRDEQTVLSEAQTRHLNRVADDDDDAKVIGWNFSYRGPLVVRGCGDWGVVNRRGRWVHISHASGDDGDNNAVVAVGVGPLDDARRAVPSSSSVRRS